MFHVSLIEFLQDYLEVPISQASRIKNVKLGDVDLWTGPKNGLFVHVPHAVLLERKLDKSACRMVLCNMLGITDDEYTGLIESVFEGGDELKLYTHANEKFAVVFEIPPKIIRENTRVRTLYKVLAAAAGTAIATAIGYGTYQRFKTKPTSAEIVSKYMHMEDFGGDSGFGVDEWIQNCRYGKC